jgi:hypothetical protein
MKRIIIELSEEQHDKMKAHQSRGAEINGKLESLSGCSIKLCYCEVGDWLEIEMNGVLNLGDVNWKIE